MSSLGQWVLQNVSDEVSNTCQHFPKHKFRPHGLLNIAGLADIRSWRIVLIETITIEVALPTLPAITFSYCKVRAHFLPLFGNKHVESKSMVLCAETWEVSALPPILARSSTCIPSQIMEAWTKFINSPENEIPPTLSVTFVSELN